MALHLSSHTTQSRPALARAGPRPFTAISLARPCFQPRSSCRAQAAKQEERLGWASSIKQATAGVLLAGALALAPAPAFADVQMVAPASMQQLAKPLPKQEVNKPQVWTVFVGGAALLFGATLLAENNSNWFPAISKANQFMRMKNKQIAAEEKQAAQEEAEWREVQRQQSAVEAGLKEAKQKVLAEPSAPAPPPVMPRDEATSASTTQPAHSAPVVNIPQVLSAADAEPSASHTAAAPAASSSETMHAPAATSSSSSSSAAQEPEQPSTPTPSYAVVSAEPPVITAWSSAPVEPAPAAAASTSTSVSTTTASTAPAPCTAPTSPASNGSPASTSTATAVTIAAAAAAAPAASASVVGGSAEDTLVAPGEGDAEARAQRLANFVSGVKGPSGVSPLEAYREEARKSA